MGGSLSMVAQVARPCSKVLLVWGVITTHVLLLVQSNYRVPCDCSADTTTGSDAASAALRGFTYQAVGQAAVRAPHLFRGDASIAARLFAALASEQAGVRAALQEALSQLASAYRGCSGAGSNCHIFHACTADDLV